jgi:hypothetical protein
MAYSYDRNRSAAGPDPKALLHKFMEHAQVPEKELIALAEKFDAEGNKEVLHYIDEAINFFAKARGALDHAKMRLK